MEQRGEDMVSTAAIIEARMGSTRLPGKSMKLLNGIPLLERVVKRALLSKKNKKVIIATTKLPEDDIIEELSKKLNVGIFRGSPDNVMGRVLNAAEHYNVETIISLQGDSPFLDPSIIDNVLQNFYNLKPCDYISNTLEVTFPIGTRVQVFQTNILKKAYGLTKSNLDKEHVTTFICDHPEIFMLENFSASIKLNRPDIRLTIDYKEDFDLAEKICKLLPDDENFQLEDVIKVYDENDLSKINSHINHVPIYKK